MGQSDNKIEKCCKIGNNLYIKYECLLFQSLINMATLKHCAFCFKTIYSVLNSEPRPSFQSDLESPLFVTWTTGPDHDLRGCIGTFKSDRLDTLLPQYAMISAFSDHRFKPITLKELPSLSVAVSLLINFEKKGKNALDWQIGKNGIIIQFQTKGEHYNGTFLPEVAKEQSWDQMTTIRHLTRKAGYKGSVEKILPEIELTTYQSSKMRMSFEEWQESKNIKL